MESVKISPKKCKIAMALADHHRAATLELNQCINYIFNLFIDDDTKQ